MALIRLIVKQTLDHGYLTPETEERLRQLYGNGCDLADIEALTMLQWAVTSGHVKRQATPSLSVVLESNFV